MEGDVERLKEDDNGWGRHRTVLERPPNLC